MTTQYINTGNNVQYTQGYPQQTLGTTYTTAQPTTTYTTAQTTYVESAPVTYTQQPTYVEATSPVTYTQPTYVESSPVTYTQQPTYVEAPVTYSTVPTTYAQNYTTTSIPTYTAEPQVVQYESVVQEPAQQVYVSSPAPEEPVEPEANYVYNVNHQVYHDEESGVDCRLI